MNPGRERWVEELQPLVPHMVHERVTQEQMLEPETRRHASEIKQVPATTWHIIPNINHSLTDQLCKIKSSHHNKKVYNIGLLLIVLIVFLK